MEVTGDAVTNVFVSHYESFLGTDMVCELLDSEGLFDKQVSDSSNEEMTRPITDVEIKRAMFGIGNDKAPGPDGFTSVFFKKSWDIVGQDICKVVRDFFHNGKLLKEINHTFIALILKVTTPQKELMHNYHLDRGPPRCSFKVDIQKAYDTVDWRFLVGILSIMSFFESELPVKYLGVPLISSRLLNKDCKILVEKARNRIGDWKNKSLSFAGRLQLYWKSICLPKSEGGLGLRSLEVFNLALMTTHIWNIVTHKESLWLAKAPILCSVRCAWEALRQSGNEVSFGLVFSLHSTSRFSPLAGHEKVS
ncbi:hypothetical protein Tco_1164686 [Tanacetum coccineum]